MKSVLALIAGLVVMVVSIALIQALGHSIYPAPADLDTSSADAMATYVATLPPSETSQWVQQLSANRLPVRLNSRLLAV